MFLFFHAACIMIHSVLFAEEFTKEHRQLSSFLFLLNVV